MSHKLTSIIIATFAPFNESSGLNSAVTVPFDEAYRESAQHVAHILCSIVKPQLEREDTSWEDVEWYHFGLQNLIADCVKCLIANALEFRHVKKIISDVMTTHPCRDLTQYCIETGLLNEVDGDALVEIVRAAMVANPKACNELKQGKEKAIGALVGAVMKQHKSSPIEIQTIIKRELGLS